MGREIRRVPPGWEHPRQDCRHSPWNGGCDEAKRNGGKCYRPLFDDDYETVAKKWVEDFDAFRCGEHESQKGEYKTSSRYFWEYDAPPDSESYRPAFQVEPTCYQVYETVSEGTLTSPVFADLSAMEEWLVGQGHSRTSAAAFCKHGWVPSMIMSVGAEGVKVFSGIDAADQLKKGGTQS